MTRTRLCLCLALLALPALPAQAQENSPLASLDTNGDGAVSRPEFDALRQSVFARIDRDASGTLTAQEVEAAAQERAAARTGGGDPWSRDRNGDGVLTLAEFTAQSPGFDRADRNGDGQLSAAELDRIARLLGALATPNP